MFRLRRKRSGSTAITLDERKVEHAYQYVLPKMELYAERVSDAHDRKFSFSVSDALVGFWQDGERQSERNLIANIVADRLRQELAETMQEILQNLSEELSSTSESAKYTLQLRMEAVKHITIFTPKRPDQRDIVYARL